VDLISGSKNVIVWIEVDFLKGQLYDCLIMVLWENV
jgi:hypothetical protein